MPFGSVNKNLPILSTSSAVLSVCNAIPPLKNPPSILVPRYLSPIFFVINCPSSGFNLLYSVLVMVCVSKPVSLPVFCP